MTHASLFSGIGGFDLAAEWAGWTNVFNCEIDSFCQRVLRYHFPNAKQYSDVKTVDFSIHRGRVDVLTGGFPCQPFSLAGKRRGTNDNRYLWPEMLRAIREIEPSWVVGENVYGIVNWSGGMVFEQVQSDLEDAGYEVQPFVIPACAVDAPHRRDRVWFVARRRNVEDSISNGLARKPCSCEANSGEWEQRMSCAGDSKWVGGETRPFAPDGSNAGTEILQREGAVGIRESRAFANPNHKRQHELYDSSVAGQKGQSFGSDSSGNASNSLRQRGAERAEEVQSKFPKRDGADGSNGQQYAARGIPCWRAFPTQSPVCGRDDGLSARLDACPVPEWLRPNGRFRFSGYWRRESIKAYGNAVVPQVVHEIFKAINEYETL